MRRSILGWALTVLGLCVALLGLALAVFLGPDGRRTTGPHEIETDGSVVVTAPRVIRWVDVQVDILVEVPVKKPIFVGLGNTVDVENLVDDVRRVEVTRFAAPWKLTTVDREGERPTVQAAPTSLDWWLADAAGLGGASISTTLPDEPVSLAITSIGSSNLSGLKVSLAYGIKGGFLKGLGLLLMGIGAVLGGRMLRRGDPAFRDDDADDEIVYVYVDDDGVEHQLTEAEVAAGGFDVVEEEDVVEIEDDGPPVADDGPDLEVEAESEPQIEPEPQNESEPQIEPEPQNEPEPRIGSAPTYVWIDDDGVEHELTEAELAELGDDEYEIVDEEDDR